MGENNSGIADGTFDHHPQVSSEDFCATGASLGGSMCPAQWSASPVLTIMAPASRLAERMISGAAMSGEGR